MTHRKANITQTILAVIALFGFLFVAGCISSDKKKSSGIGLYTAEQMFVSAGRASKRLCESGNLSKIDCETAESAYSDGREVLIRAKAVWDIMVEADSFKSNTEYEALLIELADLTVTIEEIVRKYKEDS